jgi:hypothetical protein
MVDQVQTSSRFLMISMLSQFNQVQTMYRAMFNIRIINDHRSYQAQVNQSREKQWSISKVI